MSIPNKKLAAQLFENTHTLDRKEIDELLKYEREPEILEEFQKLRSQNPPPIDEAADNTENRYKLLYNVDEGGMGVICRVWDRRLRRVLAMKYPKASEQEPERLEEFLTRFREEAYLTAQLDHPGVVPVHDLEIGESPYFTMRFVKGQELRGVIELAHREEEGWNLSRVIGVMVNVCQTMAHAHEKGVVHRDLKPANIMVGRRGEVYVMDWGLAKVVGKTDHRDIRIRPRIDSLSSIKSPREQDDAQGPETPLVTMDGRIVGTPAYMPPEQAQGKIDEVDQSSDVYSLGAILYHVIAGQVPFVVPGASMTPHTLLARVLEGPPKRIHKINPRAPAELVAICEKAMARAKADRHPTSLELADELQAYLDQRVVKSYETGAVAELKKWVRRNRFAAASLSLAVAGLVSVAIVQTVMHGRVVEARDIAEHNEEVSKFYGTVLEKAFIPGFPTTSGFSMRRMTDNRIGRPEITMHEVLDAARSSLGTDFQKADPQARAKFHSAIASGYATLGLYSDSAMLLKEAEKIWRDLVNKDPDAVEHRLALAATLHNLAFALGMDLYQTHLEAVFQARHDTLRNLAEAVIKLLFKLDVELMTTAETVRAHLEEALDIVKDVGGPFRATEAIYHADHGIVSASIPLLQFAATVKAKGMLWAVAHMAEIKQEFHVKMELQSERLYRVIVESMQMLYNDAHEPKIADYSDFKSYLEGWIAKFWELTRANRNLEARALFDKEIAGFMFREIGDTLPVSALEVIGHQKNATDEDHVRFLLALEAMATRKNLQTPVWDDLREMLANKCSYQGRTDDAIRLYDAVLKRRVETLGDEDPETLRVLFRKLELAQDHELAWAGTTNERLKKTLRGLGRDDFEQAMQTLSSVGGSNPHARQHRISALYQSVYGDNDMETLNQLLILTKWCDDDLLKTWRTIARGFEAIEKDAELKTRQARRQIERLEKK